MVSESKMFVKDEAKVSSRVEVSSEDLCILASWFLSPMSQIIIIIIILILINNNNNNYYYFKKNSSVGMR